MNRITSPHPVIRPLVLGMMGVCLLAFSGSVSYAATNCYDFSKPASDKQYNLGDTIETDHGAVRVIKLVTEDGDAMTPNPSGATIHNNVPIPGEGENPSLLNHGGLTIHVTPEHRASSVTIRFAENTGAADNQLWNFGVNGKRQIWRGQLSALNGQYLGTQQDGGRVRIAVDATADPAPSSYWVRGTVTLTADPVDP